MGCFIVLEGGDGSGKTTQARILVERLRSLGRDVTETFEPGATASGAEIRALILDGTGPINATTETLLLAADRAQEVADVVRPALTRGADVVSDRYVPSALAYQGIARGLGVERVEELNRWVTGSLEPDLVVVLDVDAAVAESRLTGPGDRLESAGALFHATVRDAYRALAPDRGWVVVDANPAVDVVAESVWDVVRDRLGL